MSINGIVYGASGLIHLLFLGHAKISVLELAIGGGYARVVSVVVVVVTYRSLVVPMSLVFSFVSSDMIQYPAVGNRRQ